MKKHTFIIQTLLIIIIFSSCRDESTLPYNPNEVLANKGAYLKIIDISSSQFNMHQIDEAIINFKLEEFDALDGGLLDNITLGVRYVDTTPNNGDNSKPLKTISNFKKSSFYESQITGLPRLIITLNASEAISLLDLTIDEISEGDFFRYEWTLNLTDGRSFDMSNTGNSVAEWDFYNSPFFMDISVTFLFDDTFAVGDYRLSAPIFTLGYGFGDPYRFTCSDCEGQDNGIVTLSKGEKCNERVFNLVYAGFYHLPPGTMSFEFLRGNKVNVLTESSNAGISCGGEILWVTNENSDYGLFKIENDSLITIKFIDDFTGDCGLTEPITLTLIKI